MGWGRVLGARVPDGDPMQPGAKAQTNLPRAVTPNKSSDSRGRGRRMTRRNLLLRRALLLRVLDRLVPELRALKAARVRERFSAAVGEDDERKRAPKLEFLIFLG